MIPAPVRLKREAFCRHCGKRVRAWTAEELLARGQRHARNCHALKRAEAAEDEEGSCR